MRKALLLACLGVAIGAPAPAGATSLHEAHIGCFSYAHNEILPVAHPNGRCSFYRPAHDGGRPSTDEGIENVHWRHWGARTTMGHGQFFDSLGYPHHAVIAAFQLKLKTPPGQADPCVLATYYARVRVIFKSVNVAGRTLPGGSHTFNTTPDDIGC
jgi:hypothetical protein